MNWCFAIINNKLAELYFEKDKGEVRYLGHCYVKREEYTSTYELKMIENDTSKVRLVYRNGEYKRKPQ